MSSFRPLLAAQVEREEDVRFPVYASPKLDGVRCLSLSGPLLSRTLKRIPNLAVQWKFYSPGHQWDGELVVGDPTAPDCYRKTVSTVMSIEGPSDGVRWLLFDDLGRLDEPFEQRLEALQRVSLPADVELVEQRLLRNLDELLDYELSILADGFEGLILRSPGGRYKFGRSTLREGIMLKMKRFADDEAEVIGFEELLHNSNPAHLDELGLTKRSSHMTGKVPAGTLGALRVRWRDVEFNIGTGFTSADRQEIWANRDRYLGKLVKFKYLPAGIKDAPRHPVFLGWRSKIDV